MGCCLYIASRCVKLTGLYRRASDAAWCNRSRGRRNLAEKILAHRCLLRIRARITIHALRMTTPTPRTSRPADALPAPLFVPCSPDWGKRGIIVFVGIGPGVAVEAGADVGAGCCVAGTDVGAVVGMGVGPSMMVMGTRSDPPANSFSYQSTAPETSAEFTASPAIRAVKTAVTVIVP